MEDSRIFDEGSTVIEPVQAQPEIESKKDDLIESLEKMLETKFSDSQVRTVSLVGSLLPDNKKYVNIINDISDVVKIIRKWRL